MKKFSFKPVGIFLFLLFIREVRANTRDNWKAEFQSMIETVKQHPTKDRMMALAKTISGNNRYAHLLDAEQLELSEKARVTLCKIPNHARYFGEEIKRMQKEVADNPAKIGLLFDYNNDRAEDFRILAQLPSPETVAVLGEFLSDDIDTPSVRISPGSDWGENPPANSYASACMITILGLRDSPVAAGGMEGIEGVVDKRPRNLAKIRGWWEEVKSGERPFSFLGQAVEYRFLPDGTWETLAIADPPDDAPPMPVRKDWEVKPAAPPTVAEPADPVWPWVFGASALIGGLALAIRKWRS